MTGRIAMTMAGLLALGACGGDGDRDDASGEAGKARVESVAKDGEMRLRPGQWEMKTEIAKVSAPGMPAGAAEMMKTAPTTVTTCISEQEANDPNVFTGKKDPNCNTDGFSAAGGKVSGTITCAAEAGGQGKLTMAMEGEFKPDSYALETRMTTEGEGAQMTIESRTSGRRLGDCPAESAG